MYVPLILFFEVTLVSLGVKLLLIGNAFTNYYLRIIKGILVELYINARHSVSI